MGPDIDMKFHQEVMEIVSYDILRGFLLYEILSACHLDLLVSTSLAVGNDQCV